MIFQKKFFAFFLEKKISYGYEKKNDGWILRETKPQLQDFSFFSSPHPYISPWEKVKNLFSPQECFVIDKTTSMIYKKEEAPLAFSFFLFFSWYQERLKTFLPKVDLWGVDLYFPHKSFLLFYRQHQGQHPKGKKVLWFSYGYLLALALWEKFSQFLKQHNKKTLWSLLFIEDQGFFYGALFYKNSLVLLDPKEISFSSPQEKQKKFEAFLFEFWRECDVYIHQKQQYAKTTSGLWLAMKKLGSFFSWNQKKEKLLLVRGIFFAHNSSFFEAFQHYHSYFFQEQEPFSSRGDFKSSSNNNHTSVESFPSFSHDFHFSEASELLLQENKNSLHQKQGYPGCQGPTVQHSPSPLSHDVVHSFYHQGESFFTSQETSQETLFFSPQEQDSTKFQNSQENSKKNLPFLEKLSSCFSSLVLDYALKHPHLCLQGQKNTLWAFVKFYGFSFFYQLFSSQYFLKSYFFLLALGFGVASWNFYEDYQQTKEKQYLLDSLPKAYPLTEEEFKKILLLYKKVFHFQWWFYHFFLLLEEFLGEKDYLHSFLCQEDKVQCFFFNESLQPKEAEFSLEEKENLKKILKEKEDFWTYLCVSPLLEKKARTPTSLRNHFLPFFIDFLPGNNNKQEFFIFLETRGFQWRTPL